MRLDEQEWWVAALVFTFHVIMAALLLLVWAAMGVLVFYGFAWLVTTL